MNHMLRFAVAPALPLLHTHACTHARTHARTENLRKAQEAQAVELRQRQKAEQATRKTELATEKTRRSLGVSGGETDYGIAAAFANGFGVSQPSPSPVHTGKDNLGLFVSLPLSVSLSFSVSLPISLSLPVCVCVCGG